ncbi:magnesium chelatase subunit D [Jannaschia faecimaris]|uniref:Magnesium chelatase subunit D n=1 Tax=Jannaschia faecimaris TaxID=1244108 RepID=A0A1H3TEY7_9RHOB|nr:VWA domain-containing protein [Jannaschia faecimaris]SDZ48391.1 magnesium chelatase subunit D [Jannaschia faecimaris]
MSHLPLILALLRADTGLGGLVLRARAGPAQTAALNLCDRALGPGPKLHPTMGPEALEGGLDVAASLAAGSLRRTAGVLDRPGPLRLPMAERATSFLATRLAAHVDSERAILIAIDEGIEEEAIPTPLAARCAFWLTLNDRPDSEEPWTARATAPASVNVPDEITDQIVTLTATLGIHDLRGPLLALRAARGIAALDGRATVMLEDATLAAELVLAPRATQIPEPPAPEQAEKPDAPEQQDEKTDLTQIPQDILLDAVRAALPPDLLAQLAQKAGRRAKGSGSGAKRQGNRRGRPLAPRGTAQAQGRVDLIATLRAAAPWQTIRKQAEPDRHGPILRKSDLRHKRYEEKSDRLLIFTVDASGSAALARLAEAKGAVELLLTEAYSRRDHVALVAFRGEGADLLLSPTRSLVQTKRRLAALPGGGGTPLAHGLIEAQNVAQMAARKGLTPTLVLLTDGRGNIALDGSRDRKLAAADVERTARGLRGLDALIIDTGNRPEPALKRLAQILNAPYIPLPRADAQRLSQAVGAALGS